MRMGLVAGCGGRRLRGRRRGRRGRGEVVERTFLSKVGKVVEWSGAERSLGGGALVPIDGVMGWIVVLARYPALNELPLIIIIIVGYPTIYLSVPYIDINLDFNINFKFPIDCVLFLENATLILI